MTFRDRVQAYKYESAAGGGSAGDEEPFPTVINVDQDALELAGLVFNDWNGGTPIHDQNVRILRIGDDLMFYDVAHSGGVSLSAMAGVPLASTAPADVTKAAAAVGVGTSAARADHKHDVTTATASAQAPGDTAAEGTATSLARSDHKHSLPAFGTSSSTFCVGNDSRLGDDRTASGLRSATTVVSVSAATAPSAGQALVATSSTLATWLTSSAPANVTKATAAVGTASDAARADHKHDVTTAAAATVSTSSTDAEGAATSLARSDHVHQVTVTTGEISNTTSRTTTSTTAVLMTGMTVTPAAGTYLVIWSGSLTTAASTQNTTFSIYSAGALVTHSERICGGAQVVIMYIPFCCVAVVTVNGSQAIEGMWRTSSGTATSTRHSLQYLRIA
jgi:hypothetical protein